MWYQYPLSNHLQNKCVDETGIIINPNSVTHSDPKCPFWQSILNLQHTVWTTSGSIWTKPYFTNRIYINYYFPLIFPSQCYIQCKLCYIQCKLCYIQCKLCYIQCKLCYMQCKLCYMQCKLCYMQCKLCYMQCKLCYIQCSCVIFNVSCVIFNASCVIFNVAVLYSM